MVNFITLSSGTSANSYYVTGLNPSTNYYFQVKDSDLIGTTTSNVFQASTVSNPVLSTTGSTSTTVSLQWSDFNTYFSFVPFVSYTVQMSSGANGPWSVLTAITSASQNTYIASGLSPGQTEYFRIYDTVGSGSLATSYSKVVSGTPIATLTATASASTSTTDIGQQVSFTSSVTGGVAPYRYQWYLNGNPISGATSSGYNFVPSSTGTFNIYVNVQDSSSIQAKSVSLSIEVPPQPTATISASTTTINVGQQVQFSASASAGVAPYTYQWYVNDNPVSGATYSHYTLTPDSQGSSKVYVKVTDSLNSQTQSNSVTITVNGQMEASASGTPLTSSMMVSNDRAILTVSMTGGSGSFTFDWYLNGEKVDSSSSSSYTYTFKNMGQQTMQAKVTDSVGNEADSNVVSISYSYNYLLFAAIAAIIVIVIIVVAVALYMRSKKSKAKQ